MRAIKFRAWDGSSEKMFNVHGNVCFSMGGKMSMPVYNKDGMVVDCELMQFTGLTDKNGVDIYEGDILSLYFYDELNNECVTVEGEGEHNPTIEVLWDKGGYWLFCEDDGTWYFPQSLDDCAEFEVIGNIHQNIELLEE